MPMHTSTEWMWIHTSDLMKVTIPCTAKRYAVPRFGKDIWKRMTLFEKSQCFKKFTKTNDTSCTYKKVLHKMISEHIQHINFSDEGRPRKNIHYPDLEWNQNNEPHTVIPFCSFCSCTLSILSYTVPRFDVHCSPMLIFSCHGFEKG